MGSDLDAAKGPSQPIMPAPRSYGGRGDGSLVARLNATVQLHPANNLMRLDKYFRSAELLQRQVGHGADLRVLA